MSLFEMILSSQKLPSVCLTVLLVSCVCVYFHNFLCLLVAPERQNERTSRRRVVSKTTF